MNDVQLEKCAWVNGYLSACLKAAGLDVYRLRYTVTGMDERGIFKAVAAIV